MKASVTQIGQGSRRSPSLSSEGSGSAEVQAGEDNVESSNPLKLSRFRRLIDLGLPVDDPLSNKMLVLKRNHGCIQPE